MSSVVCAGENVLHSMAMPAIPMRGKSSDGACLQAKEKSSNNSAGTVRKVFFMAFDLQYIQIYKRMG